MPTKKKTAVQGATRPGAGYADDIAKLFSGGGQARLNDVFNAPGGGTATREQVAKALGGASGSGSGSGSKSGHGGDPLKGTLFEGATGGGGTGNSELDALLGYAKKNDAENKLFLSNTVEPSIDDLADANAAANRGDQFTNLARYNTTAGTVAGMDEALDKMRGTFREYKGGQNALNDSDLAALSKYQGQNAALMSALDNMGWKDVTSGGKGYDAQLDALNQYKGLIDPTVTAQERLMAEVARRQAEQQERSSRDAVMADLGARGLRSSGAELTNMLGARQQIGQDRVLADMAMNANAVTRGMTALEGYGRTAGQMRSADDVISMFNGQQGQLAKQWGEEQKAKLAEDALTNTTDTNKGVGERNDTTYKGEQNVNAAGYTGAQDKQAEWDKYFNQLDVYNQNPVTRQQGLTGAKLDLGQLWTGNSRAGFQGVADALKAKAGDDASKEATAMLNKKSLIDRINPLSWLG